MAGALPVRTDSYIGGEWVATGSRLEVRNPATGELIASVSQCGAAEVSRAVASAEAAFKTWSALPAIDRCKVLRRFAALISEHKSDLAQLLTLEQGKPLSEASWEVGYGVDFLEWYAEEGRRVYGETIPASAPNKRILVLKEPIGVCAAITPWNFPNAMIVRKLAPALAAGCTLIVKPAPETPLSALALAHLAEAAGIPPGVLNVVTGDAETVSGVIMQSAAVRKISFTGSTEVGKILMRAAADTLKRVTLELGGNAPFIIFDDCEIERTLDAAIFSKFRNAGQTCICTNRFLVQRAALPAVEAGLVSRVRTLTVGNGLNPDTKIGPMISADAVGKVATLLEDALSRGAKLLIGEIPKRDHRFVAPIVLSNVPPKSRIVEEEIFGPVAVLLPFDSEEDGIALANSSRYGLASYLFTANLARAHRVAEALEFGMVGINDAALSTVQAPFGGVKESGFGREGSRHGIEEYLTLKYISLGL